jgi:hypothetical protein
MLGGNVCGMDQPGWVFVSPVDESLAIRRSSILSYQSRRAQGGEGSLAERAAWQAGRRGPGGSARGGTGRPRPGRPESQDSAAGRTSSSRPTPVPAPTAAPSSPTARRRETASPRWSAGCGRCQRAGQIGLNDHSRDAHPTHSMASSVIFAIAPGARNRSGCSGPGSHSALTSSLLPSLPAPNRPTDKWSRPLRGTTLWLPWVVKLLRGVAGFTARIDRLQARVRVGAGRARGHHLPAVRTAQSGLGNSCTG